MADYCWCGNAAVKVVMDLVDVSKLNGSWQEHEPIGVARAGCAEHPVEAIIYTPETVPITAPWAALRYVKSLKKHAMRTVRIVGTSPAPADWRIFNGETGDEIHGVLAVEIVGRAGELAKAKITLLAEVDVVAEVEEPEAKPA